MTIGIFASRRHCALLAGTLAACQATLTPPASAPTCKVAVSPASGGLATTFTASLTSMNAATCTYAVDGMGTIPVACSATFSATGAQGGGAGAHRLVVTATGANGSGTCAASWTVAADPADMALAPPPPDLTMTVVPPAPDMATAPTTLDLHQATLFDNPTNLADWPVTTTITALEFQYKGGDGVHVEFSKRNGPGSWPDVIPPGFEGPLEYTLGIAEYINGRWYASAAIQFWRGLELSGGNVALNQQIAKNWYYDGRWGALAGYQPATGEIIGVFVVAGNARGVHDDGSQSPVHERSNVVLVPMPGVNGAKYTF